MPASYTSCGAELSPCGRYRYTLTRWWDRSKSRACWVMLNPSTADAYKDDPTIARCTDFSKRAGCGGLIVVNLFAYRATEPLDLKRAIDPVGNDNDSAIRQASQTSSITVVAWGANARILGYNRDELVLPMLNWGSKKVLCLGVTKFGQPKHPLYVSGSTKLISHKV